MCLEALGAGILGAIACGLSLELLVLSGLGVAGITINHFFGVANEGA